MVLVAGGSGGLVLFSCFLINEFKKFDLLFKTNKDTMIIKSFVGWLPQHY